MPLDPVLNFAKVQLSTGYAAGVTSVVLVNGDGAKLPAPATDGAFNLVWWEETTYKDPADDPNKEIIRVTARSTDTLTITRAQEGTADVNHNTAGKTYKMVLAMTKKMKDDIGANKWELIAEYYDASNNAQNVDFSGLNLDTDRAYMILIQISYNADVNYSLFVNGDYTVTNYYVQKLTVGAASVVGVRNNDAIFVGFVSGQNYSMVAKILMMRKPDSAATYGYPRAIGEIVSGGPVSPVILQIGWSHTSYVNVTSIRINSSIADGIPMKSRIILFRLST